MNRSYPALRGLAILLVILNHSTHMAIQYAKATNPGELNPSVIRFLAVIQGLGVFAVPIFLFLSGCFFAYAAGKGDLEANYRVVWTNLKHVVIPYVVWSLLFYVEILVFHQQRFSPLGYLKNLVVGYPFNFVPLLVFNYLISPLLIRLIKRIGWGAILLAGLYQVSLLVITRPAELGLHLPSALDLLAPPVLSQALADWAIYFPLGLVVVLRAADVAAIIPRLRYLLTGLTIFTFLLAIADLYQLVSVPYAPHLSPLPFILLSATFQRNRIPAVRSMELVGKRAYGLYLTNLIVLDLTLLGIQAAAPRLLGFYPLLIPLLFALALFIPLLIMNGLERRIKPVVFRYAFG